jgi:hypothetical protein
MSGAARNRGLRMARDQRANAPSIDPSGPETEAESQNAPASNTEEEVEPHTPQEEVQEDPARDQETNTPESETLIQKYERLKAELSEKRMRQEVEAMERELAGETPATPLHIGDQTATGHKRAVSTSAEVSSAHKEFYFRPKSPPRFEGKTLKEVSQFRARWDVQFNAMGPVEESTRVAIAATGLRGMPLEAWDRRTETPETFEGFIGWCRNLVKDPANRTMHAYLKLKDAKQRKGQSVRDFVNYIEEQEKDIPDVQDDTLRKAWSLLVSLDEDIRRGVMIEHKEITSREQVIVAAQRQEELQRNVREGREDASGTQASSKRTPRLSRQRGGSTAAKPTTTQSKEEIKSRDETSVRRCWKCQSTKHIAARCPQNKEAGNTSHAGETHAESKN